MRDDANHFQFKTEAAAETFRDSLGAPDLAERYVVEPQGEKWVVVHYDGAVRLGRI